MINILLTWAGDWVALLENNDFPFNVTATEIPEMIDNTYMVLLNQADDFDALELAMESVNDVFVIGTYNMDGSHYIWGNGNRNHSTPKYHGKLKNKKEYDSQGNVVVDTPYTEEESKSVQVCRFMGWNERKLT